MIHLQTTLRVFHGTSLLKTQGFPQDLFIDNSGFSRDLFIDNSGFSPGPIYRQLRFPQDLFIDNSGFPRDLFYRKLRVFPGTDIQKPVLEPQTSQQGRNKFSLKRII